jgi:hypothetical protein
MEIVFSLTAMEENKEARTLTYGRIHLGDDWLETVPALALNRAINNEVEWMTKDMRPLLVDAVYKALHARDKLAREDAPVAE